MTPPILSTYSFYRLYSPLPLPFWTLAELLQGPFDRLGNQDATSHLSAESTLLWFAGVSSEQTDGVDPSFWSPPRGVVLPPPKPNEAKGPTIWTRLSRNYSPQSLNSRRSSTRSLAVPTKRKPRLSIPPRGPQPRGAIYQKSLVRHLLPLFPRSIPLSLRVRQPRPLDRRATFPNDRHARRESVANRANKRDSEPDRADRT